MRSIRALSVLTLILASALTNEVAAQQQPVQYRASFTAPEHHYADVEVVFRGVPAGTLELRMSRSSPGRYAIHEYAKNVFDVKAIDGKGRSLVLVRPNPYQWNVAGHDGTVRVTYRVFGNIVDGTYLGIDSSHAHMNMPATFMWARGFDARPIRITFAPPGGSTWKVATQLFPTEDAFTFTAPNLQYFMDSPTEVSNFSVRSFRVRNPDGREFTVRAAIHHDADDAAMDAYIEGTQKIVREQGAVFGEYPEFETGTYTFLGDYLPWGGGDGMEHRNSTVVAAPVSLRDPQTVRQVLGTVSHEFFHAWNVERIRPRSLEPFNFEEANMSGELWIAEGFTQYYGSLTMSRAGLSPQDRTLTGLVASALNVASSPGRRLRTVVEMSQLAPFTDAARSVDPTNFNYSFVSYYPFGAALALALDLELRTRSAGRLSLDDYMRAMWNVHGKPGGPQPGLVAKPYTLRDARDRLAEVSGDRAFADGFFAKYVEGRDIPDYAKLLAPAGVIVRKRGGAWIGAQMERAGSSPNADPARVAAPVAFDTPAFKAALDVGDTIVTIDGKPGAELPAVLKAHKPGDTVEIEFTRRSRETVKTTITLGEDGSLEGMLAETAGGTLTAEQKAFRAAWLGPKASNQ